MALLVDCFGEEEETGNPTKKQSPKDEKPNLKDKKNAFFGNKEKQVKAKTTRLRRDKRGKGRPIRTKANALLAVCQRSLYASRKLKPPRLREQK